MKVYFEGLSTPHQVRDKRKMKITPNCETQLIAIYYMYNVIHLPKPQSYPVQFD